MLRQPVSSSNLSSVGYDDASATLEIQSHNGGIYQYFNVPIEVYKRLMSASSKGSYFQAFIRERYATRRVG